MGNMFSLIAASRAARARAMREQMKAQVLSRAQQGGTKCFSQCRAGTKCRVQATHGAIWQNKPLGLGGEGGFKVKLSPAQNTQPGDGSHWKYTGRRNGIRPWSACLNPAGKVRISDHMESGI